MATPRSAGRVLIRPLGDYNAATTYEMLDSVEYDGSTYLCKQTSTGNLPKNKTYWQKMVEAPDPLIILNSEGTAMPQRSNLQFANATVTDDAENDATVITTSGGGGLHIGDVENFDSASTAGVQKITLTWDDPDDIVISGVVQAAWGGTKIVRKAGSIPVSDGDGTIVVDNTTRNQYSVTGFEDNTVAFDTTYYYRAFPYTTDGTVTDGSYVSGEAPQIHTYGVSWDGTAAPTWTRTDDAADFTDPIPYVDGATTYGSPFDNLMPWSGMTIEERTGGTMVKIPKFWYKLTQNGAGMKIQIASTAQEGFSVSPAHMDRGDGNGERDVVYIGRYHCSSSDFKSTTGQTPKVSVRRSDARTSIHNLGTDIWQMDFATRFTIWLLYLVEFADWNSQAKIGYGCGNNSNSGVEAMGYTDSMPYHTGTTQSSRTTYGIGTQYRNIEGLWDMVYDWCDGCCGEDGGLSIILNPTNFSSKAKIGTIVGMPLDLGFPSAFTVKDVSGTFCMFLPTVGNGSGSTYSCDYWHIECFTGLGNSGTEIKVGSNALNTLNSGLFELNYTNTGNTSGDTGCRIMELPNNT